MFELNPRPSDLYKPFHKDANETPFYDNPYITVVVVVATIIIRNYYALTVHVRT